MFKQTWGDIHSRVNELQRVVREMEPVLLEKRYEALTTYEEMDKSAQLLSRYNEQKEVEKSFYQERPTTDSKAKEWCYEREMAYEQDKLLTQLYKDEDEDKEKQAEKAYSCEVAEGR